MELIPHNTHINFVKYKNVFIFGSLLVNVAILVAFGLFGLNWGVDFAGGSELEVKFAEPVEDVAVRKAVEEAGFSDATVQVIGPPSDNSFLIRVGRVSLLTADQARQLEAALRAHYGADLARFEFNEEAGDKVELRFAKTPAAEELRAVLEKSGVRVRPGAEGLRPVQDGYTVITSGISEKVSAALSDAAGKKILPASEVRRVEYVGPQVGKQLRNKGILAMIYAAVMILAYIAFRFDTRFAPGAVLAMFHDVVVVFGYYVVTRREFNLTSVAVLLTLVGFSVNDTIVIYDRIRENLTKTKGMAMPQLINNSLNDTLSRTILTGFTSMLALAGLLIFGVGSIWDFAAAMILGIIVGTYSSIYVASPVTIWLDELRGKRASGAGASSAARAG